MKIYRITAYLFGLLLLSQFNNCSPTSDQADMTAPILAGCDSTYNPDPNAIINTDCTQADNNNLAINPEGGDIPVNAALQDFNVSGYCNDGAYPSNVITWTLKLNNVPVRNSGMTENGQTWNSQCVESQFGGGQNPMRVFLEPIPEDNVNRTGLLDPNTGQYTAYTLDVTIYGKDTYGVLHQNTVNGTRTINLFPE